MQAPWTSLGAVQSPREDGGAAMVLLGLLGAPLRFSSTLVTLRRLRKMIHSTSLSLSWIQAQGQNRAKLLSSSKAAKVPPGMASISLLRCASVTKALSVP